MLFDDNKKRLHLNTTTLSIFLKYNKSKGYTTGSSNNLKVIHGLPLIPLSLSFIAQ